MIKVSSKVKLNMPRIRQLSQAQVTALEQTAEYVHTEVVQAQVMPRDTGAMQGEKTFIKAGESTASTYASGEIATNSITKESGGTVSIITASPQVRRLYFHPEYNFQKMENPNAGAFWYDDWIPGGKRANEVIDAYKKLYRRLGGL